MRVKNEGGGFVIGFDFDGVLAELCEGEIFKKPWKNMSGAERDYRSLLLLEHYSTAKPIMSPTEKNFAVITARKATPEIYLISKNWLSNNYPRAQHIHLHMLPNSRSIPNVVSFKGAVINALQITDFFEDNVKVVSGLRKTTSARVWLYRHGRLILD
jgi:hypothetical protein